MSAMVCLDVSGCPCAHVPRCVSCRYMVPGTGKLAACGELPLDWFLLLSGPCGIAVGQAAEGGGKAGGGCARVCQCTWSRGLSCPQAIWVKQAGPALLFLPLIRDDDVTAPSATQWPAACSCHVRRGAAHGGRRPLACAAARVGALPLLASVMIIVHVSRCR
jgi:hypothetical protein